MKGDEGAEMLSPVGPQQRLPRALPEDEISPSRPVPYMYLSFSLSFYLSIFLRQARAKHVARPQSSPHTPVLYIHTWSTAYRQSVYSPLHNTTREAHPLASPSLGSCARCSVLGVAAWNLGVWCGVVGGGVWWVGFMGWEEMKMKEDGERA